MAGTTLKIAGLSMGEVQELAQESTMGEVGISNFVQPVEKPWSVKIHAGYFSDSEGYVRAKQCGNCRSVPELLAINNSNPNLILLGCREGKCRNRLMRLETG